MSFFLKLIGKSSGPSDDNVGRETQPGDIFFRGSEGRAATARSALDIVVAKPVDGSPPVLGTRSEMVEERPCSSDTQSSANETTIG